MDIPVRSLQNPIFYQLMHSHDEINQIRYNTASLIQTNSIMESNMLYALDFDGVICDSAIETAMTGWLAARQIWTEMPALVPADLPELFRQVRPNIETGYEAILAMRLLDLGYDCQTIFDQYQALSSELMTEANVSVDDLKQLFGATRDHWIAEDLDSWITHNPLFDSLAERLRVLDQHHAWLIITTKQERFVSQILAANEIALDAGHIFGLDRNMSKVEVLRQLIQSHPQSKIIFVEDRLPTLLNVAKQADLKSVELQFARWGYNTEADKQLAVQQGFTSIELNDFLRF
jgi:phosphoglycolate phosphatase-like HAD superfamily hydrolase